MAKKLRNLCFTSYNFSEKITSPKSTSLHQSEMLRTSPRYGCRPDHTLVQLNKQIPRNGLVSSIVQRMIVPVFRFE